MKMHDIKFSQSGWNKCAQTQCDTDIELTSTSLKPLMCVNPSNIHYAHVDFHHSLFKLKLRHWPFTVSSTVPFSICAAAFQSHDLSWVHVSFFFMLRKNWIYDYLRAEPINHHSDHVMWLKASEQLLNGPWAETDLSSGSIQLVYLW